MGLAAILTGAAEDGAPAALRITLLSVMTSMAPVLILLSALADVMKGSQGDQQQQEDAQTAATENPVELQSSLL